MRNVDLKNETPSTIGYACDWISTEELARQAVTTPATIRVRLCKSGSYFGIRPKKLPNGRLLWPSNSLSLLLEVKEGGEE